MGSKRHREFHVQRQYLPFSGRGLKMLMVSPPPQRRQRARSFPVPSGRTATGGRTGRFSLSATMSVSEGELMSYNTERQRQIKHLSHPEASPQCHPLHRPKSCIHADFGRNAVWGKRQYLTLRTAGRCHPSGCSYPGAGPPFDRLYTWRGFSRYWNFLSTLQRNKPPHESLESCPETTSTRLIETGYLSPCFPPLFGLTNTSRGWVSATGTI